MEAFLAFQEQEAEALGAKGASGVLSPKMFGNPFTYLPLKETVEMAIDAALHSSKSPPASVSQETTWYVLKITLNADQFLEAFKSGVLRSGMRGHPRRGAPVPGWRWYGEIPIGEFAHCWSVGTVPPLGIETWAEKVLTPKYQLKAFGRCAGCNRQGDPVWTSNHKFNYQDFCASCWNAFMMRAKDEANKPEDEEVAQDIVD